MSPTEIVAFITAVSLFITSVSSFVIGWRNSRAIKQVHDATNSMKDELVAEVRKQEHARGLKEGRAEKRRPRQATKRKHK